VSEDEILPHEIAAKLLLPVGWYLQNEFSAIAPPGLTRGTVKAIVQYLEHRSRVNSESIVHDLTGSHPGAALRDRWVAEGGSEDELVKFVTMGEHRVRVLQAATWMGKTPGASSELEAFWVTGGHDLTELARYLSYVDAEVGDWLPK